MTAQAPETVKLTRHSAVTSPLLKARALISATLPSRDLAASEAFYTEALGLEVRRLAEDRLVVRLGTDHVYEIEKVDREIEMPILRHNGFQSRGDLVAEHARLQQEQAEYGVKKMTKPMVQHGTFGFYMQDRDGNWWEGNLAVDGPMDEGLEDLTDHPDMTPEQTRARFAPGVDILADRISAYREDHKDDNTPPKPSIFQSIRISHGTLEVNNLQESRRFYEEVLGLNAFQQSPISMMVGLGTDHRYVAVAANDPSMEHCLRNRLIFDSEVDLLDAHNSLKGLPATHVTELSKPDTDTLGRLAFEFLDLDRNWWELYYDPQGAPSRHFD